MGVDEPIVWEVVIAPDAFAPDSGALESNTVDATVLRYFFDKKGNAFMRSEGSVLLFVREKLQVVVRDDISFSTDKNFFLTAKGTGRVDGGDLLELAGKIVKIGGGNNAVAHVGSTVQALVGLVGLHGVLVGTAVTIPAVSPITGQPQALTGTVTAGNEKVRV